MRHPRIVSGQREEEVEGERKRVASETEQTRGEEGRASAAKGDQRTRALDGEHISRHTR